MAGNDVRITVTVDNATGPGIAAALASLGLLAQQTRRTGDEGIRTSDVFAALGSVVATTGRKVAAAGQAMLASAADAGKLASTMYAASKAATVLGNGLAAALRDVGASLAKLPPLVAFLPSLIGAFALLKTTLSLAGPGLAKAFEPITQQFKNAKGEATALTKELQRVIGIDVQPAAMRFVEKNMFNISEAMKRIAYQTNLVVAGSLRWANTTQGVAAIKAIVSGTADAVTKLTPKLILMVEAFGNFAGKAGGRAIEWLGDMIGRIVDKLALWANTHDLDDINGALATLSGYGHKLKATFGAIRDGVEWLSANQGKLKAFSDAVAATTLTIGIATGNIPAILAASTALIVNHFDKFKALFGKSAKELMHVFDGSTMPAEVLDSFRNIWEQVGPFASEQFGRITKAITENKHAFEVLGRFIADYVIPIFAFFVFDMLIAVVNGIVNTINFIGALVETFESLYNTVKTGMINMVLAVVNGIDIIVTGFAKIPGPVGESFRKAAAEVHEWVEKINNDLKNIRDEDVYIRTHFVGGQGQSRGGDYATGGITGAMSYAATGGVRGGLVKVGEHGAELIRTPTGSMVYPKANTNQLEVMAAQMGARGGTAVELRITGSGALYELLMQAQRSGELQILRTAIV